MIINFIYILQLVLPCSLLRVQLGWLWTWQNLHSRNHRHNRRSTQMSSLNLWSHQMRFLAMILILQNQNLNQIPQLCNWGSHKSTDMHLWLQFGKSHINLKFLPKWWFWQVMCFVKQHKLWQETRITMLHTPQETVVSNDSLVSDTNFPCDSFCMWCEFSK